MVKKIYCLLFLSVLFSCSKPDTDPVGGGDEGRPAQEHKPTRDLKNVFLSEINAAEDFVEIYNAGEETVMLEGAKIRRMRTVDGADDEQTLWEGAAGMTLASGKYLCLKYVEGKENVSTNLKRNLSGKRNTYVWLQDSNKKIVSEFRRGEKGTGWNMVHMQPEVDEYSYTAAIPSAKDTWFYSAPTPGSENGAKMGEIDQTMMYVVINEIDLANSRFELYNNSTEEIDLTGFQLRWSRINKDGEADNKTVWAAEDGTKISPKGFLVAESDTDLSSFVQKNLHIRLRDSRNSDFVGEKLIWDDVKRGNKGGGWTTVDLGTPIVGNMARIPDGGGDWYQTGNPSIGSTNGITPGQAVPDWEGY